MRFVGFEEKDNVVQERQKKMTEMKTEYDDVYERLTRVTGELAQTVSLIIHHGTWTPWWV